MQSSICGFINDAANSSRPVADSVRPVTHDLDGSINELFSA